jgi:C1A family cysteine protease
MEKRNLTGWKRQKEDVRDYKLTLKAVKLPTFFSLKNKMPPVIDQGDYGACVSCSAVYLLGYLMNIHKVKFVQQSPSFIYWNGRVIEHTETEDSGLVIRDALKGMTKKGVCSLKAWPYDSKHMFRQPWMACFTEGAKHKLTSYLAVQDNITSIKQALYSGYPVTCGVTCYDSFLSDETAKTGIIPMPKDGESDNGGHCITLYGFDDSKKWFMFRNTWSTEWGYHGDGYISYDYMKEFGADYWILKKEDGF